MLKVWMWLFPALFGIDPMAAPQEWTITPGKSIGKISIGQSQNEVRRTLGKPDRSFKTHSGRPGDRWQRDRFEVVYKANKVVQIQTYIPQYKTPSGLSTSSTLASVKRIHPQLKCTTYYFNAESGEGLSYYDDVRAGITYLVPVPWKDDKKPEETWIIIVHPTGMRAIPTLIKDPSNSQPGDPKESKRTKRSSHNTGGASPPAEFLVMRGASIGQATLGSTIGSDALKRFGKPTTSIARKNGLREDTREGGVRHDPPDLNTTGAGAKIR